MPKKAMRAGAGTGGQSSDVTYLLCRWWPFFAPEFPFERFDYLSDNSVEDEMEKLRREVVEKYEAAIRDRFKPSAISRARNVATAPGVRSPQPAARSFPDRPISFAQAFGHMGWVKRVVHNVEIQVPTLTPFRPTRRSVFHVSTAERASAIVGAVQSRIQPLEGQYRFTTVDRTDLPVDQQIQYERDLELLQDAEVTLPPPGAVLALYALPFCNTANGVPVWAVALRDEAREVERVVGSRGLAVRQTKSVSGAAVRPKRGKGGRHPAATAKQDRQMSDAMRSGQHLVYADLASAFGVTEREARRAVDRHRASERRQRGRRPPTNSPDEFGSKDKTGL